VPDATPMVEVRDLVKRYGRTLAIDGISLDIAQGERYAVLGPNGAGKTTLIHVLATIHRADRGTATIGGVEVHRHPLRARRHLGVVFQEPSLDTRLTVMENLEFHGRIFGVPGRLRRQRIADLLEVVELGDWRDHLVRSLSKGMQRRLEIARALVHDAALLILDEPTIGLDAQTRARMWSYLDDLQRRRELTILVTTHYIDEVDDCDRVCIVDHGKVLTVGSPDELKRRHGVTVVRVVPIDAATAAELQAAHPGAVQEGEAWLVPNPDDDAVEGLLSRFGTRLRAFNVERPTLETVFLSLTGRAIRDQAAGARDRLLAFAQRGGEHTR
jgi:ABC-2 type transport system ATP-binding protein